jgi:hypothetical protein
MQTVVYYVAEDGKQFVSKNDCMNHNIDLINWTEFRGTYWVDVNIQKTVNTYGIKETNYDIKLIPFEILDKGVTLYSQFCKPNYYLYIPNEEMVNVFKSYRNYFYPIDRPFIAELEPGVNYPVVEGNSFGLKNIGRDLKSLRADFRDIKEKIEQLEQLDDKVLTRIMTFERNM